MNFEEKYNELHEKAERVNNLGHIYEKVKESMKWDCMQYHEPDDEHEESWFTEPDEDHYQYSQYQVYQEVLEAIEKLANK
jgi:hypothetical protein